MVPNINSKSTTTSQKQKIVKGDGVSIKVTETPSSYLISAVGNKGTSKSGGGGSSPSVYMCKVVSKQGAVYTVDIYENGLGSASTGTGEMEVAGLNLAETIPANTPVMVLASCITVTGA